MRRFGGFWLPILGLSVVLSLPCNAGRKAKAVETEDLQAEELTAALPYLKIVDDCREFIGKNSRRAWSSRYHSIQKHEITYMPHESYSEPNAFRLYPPMDMSHLRGSSGQGYSSANSSLAVFNHPILTKADEFSLFHRMNFLKYRAARTKQQLPKEFPWPLSETARERIQTIERDLLEAFEIRTVIWTDNGRLVDGQAKKYRKHLNPADPNEGYVDAVAMGLLVLQNAVEKFEIGRGYKFSTYAVNGIWRTLWREGQVRARRVALQEPELGFAGTLIDNRETDSEGVNHKRREFLREFISKNAITEREKEMLFYRYGLNEGDGEVKTFEATGEKFEITKERVRQIELRLLGRLRGIAERLDLRFDDF